MLKTHREGNDEEDHATGLLSSGVRIGAYEITGFIGAGGMGEVYRAHDTNLNRVVALKLLPADLVTDPERLSRFEEEARTVSALNHPAIVTIYDAGQVGSRPFISMELVAGETLRELLRSGPIPLRRALRIAGQLSEGLSKAHEVGLVHRDLKPENVKVSVDGFVKILDFGLAKRTPSGMSDGSLPSARTAIQTTPGMLLGTAEYMSPEQASGGSVDFSSDQFSFGAMLYEMLTGKRAFDRPTFAETLSAVIREEPRRIAELNPAVPPPVRWIVERCLAKDAHERYAQTRDLARDLASVREHLTELIAPRRRTPLKRVAREASVAVLPVVSVSNDPQQEPMADAMTDALIAELTQCDGVRVLSRTCSMVYRGRHTPLRDIAEELDVKWILLASMAHAGRQIRITAQLVDGVNDENRWARSYTRSARNVLSMQSEVAAAVAQAVSTVLGTPEHLAAAG